VGDPDRIALLPPEQHFQPRPWSCVVSVGPAGTTITLSRTSDATIRARADKTISIVEGSQTNSVQVGTQSRRQLRGRADRQRERRARATQLPVPSALTAQILSAPRIAGSPKRLAPIIGQLLQSNRHARGAAGRSRSENGCKSVCFARWPLFTRRRRVSGMISNWSTCLSFRSSFMQDPALPKR